MKTLPIGALLLIVSSAASAQVRPAPAYPTPGQIRAAGDGALARMSYNRFERWQSGEEKECLVKRTTGQLVCMTRPEWRRVAERLSSK
jgi:hypothetical protein